MDFEDTINNSDFEDDLINLDSMVDELESFNMDTHVSGHASATGPSTSELNINLDEEDDIARAIEMSLMDNSNNKMGYMESPKSVIAKSRKEARFPRFNDSIDDSTIIPTPSIINKRNNRTAHRPGMSSNSDANSFRDTLNNVMRSSREEHNQQMRNFKFRTRPMEMLPNKYHANMYGKINQSSDKIIIPETIMTQLYNGRDIMINDGVLVVEIHTYGSSDVKYGTVSQYTEDDICYLPNLMFYGMLIEPDTICHFRITDDIPKAKRVILKPEIYEFMHIKDQMKLMYNEFNTNFRLLRSGQQIIINSDEVKKELTFIVEELYDKNNKKIDLGTIFDTDLEVEFKISAEFNKMYADEQAEKRRIKEAEARKRRLRENPPMSGMKFNSTRRPNINTFGDTGDNDSSQQRFNGGSTNLMPGGESRMINLPGAGPPERFQGEGHTLGGRTDRLLSREELRRKRLQNLKFIGKGNKLGEK